MANSSSHALFLRAQRCLPGGVNSPVRAFRAVGGEPFFVESADGPYLFSVDGQRYIDYVNSWGPMIIGHNHPAVRDAVMRAATRGLSYGMPCESEVLMAETVTRLVPSCQMVRMVNSGTEATLSVIRLARGVTKRNYLVKCEGGYHGHADACLVTGGSGMLTLGIPSSPGVPDALSALTLSIPFNNPDQATALFKAKGEEIAALIIEPVMGNANFIPPQPGYLQHIRHLCTQYGVLLIFDEVMTGFRVGLGGAQGLYNVTPDLTTFGKIIGGGMPVGAYGGRADLMQQITPAGPIYQAGTLSGNPVAMAAGLAMLEAIQAPGFYDTLAQSTAALCSGLEAIAKEQGVAFSTQSIGGMFGLFFSEQPATRFSELAHCDLRAFQVFFHAMLAKGVFFAPSAYEAGFVSSAHHADVIQDTLEAASSAFAACAAHKQTRVRSP